MTSGEAGVIGLPRYMEFMKKQEKFKARGCDEKFEGR